MVSTHITAFGAKALFASLAAVAAWLLYIAYQHLDVQARRKTFEAKHGCQPPTSILPYSDPLGLRFMYKILQAAKQGEILKFFHDNLALYGRTHLNPTWRRTAYITNDAENIKAVLSTHFDDWTVKETRQEAVKDLLGDGIFTTDGAFWAHSRAMLRPSFEKSHVADLSQFESHLAPLLSHIPKDGSPVDLQPIFHQFTMDTSTELLTGTSTHSLQGDHTSNAQQFVDDFEIAMFDAVIRTRLGKLYYLLPHFQANKAIKRTKQFVNVYVERAMRLKQQSSTANDNKGEKSKSFVFLEELAKHEEVDATRIRDECLNILLAGRDTTAGLLSHLWYMLARRPDVWQKLQSEVASLDGELPTYEVLRNLKYMKYCVSETLRLFPPVPVLTKLAARDTVLPHGGGSDGLQPVFVPKGSVVLYDMQSLMRQKTAYGEDAESFRPERWAEPSLRPGWDFMAFGGGPRVCLGQQYALNETYYITIRLMQHFSTIECRDDKPWKEKLTVTLASLNGTKVALSA